jgi:uncharacterized protein YajQ (UPF0234 family)
MHGWSAVVVAVVLATGVSARAQAPAAAGADDAAAELAKKLVKLIKDSGLKVQASIQGEAVRVNGAKRDTLQDAISLVKKSITDFPLKYGNFRD